MVLVPWGRDQPGAAARAHALGVAEVVDRDKAAPESISAAIDAVLANDPMRHQARRGKIACNGPTATATAFVEELLAARHQSQSSIAEH